MNINLTESELSDLRQLAEADRWNTPDYVDCAQILASVLLKIIQAAEAEADYRREQKDR